MRYSRLPAAAIEPDRVWFLEEIARGSRNKRRERWDTMPSARRGYQNESFRQNSTEADLLHEELEWHLVDSRERLKLHHIDPPLSGLTLCDE